MKIHVVIVIAVCFAFIVPQTNGTLIKKKLAAKGIVAAKLLGTKAIATGILAKKRFILDTINNSNKHGGVIAAKKVFIQKLIKDVATLKTNMISNAKHFGKAVVKNAVGTTVGIISHTFLSEPEHAHGFQSNMEHTHPEYVVHQPSLSQVEYIDIVPEEIYIDQPTVYRVWPQERRVC